MRKLSLFFCLLLSCVFLNTPSIRADETVKIHATVLIASNSGNDFDLVNDDFRDQLIHLFSYSAYHQAEEYTRELAKSKREKITLPGGYDLVLTLQGEEKGRVLVQAMIRKGNQQYVDTVLSILRPGVVFVGGPPLNDGALIIVLETVI